MSPLQPIGLRDYFETVMITSRKHPSPVCLLFSLSVWHWEGGSTFNPAHPWPIRQGLIHINSHMETFVYTKIIPRASPLPFRLFFFTSLPFFLFYGFFFEMWLHCMVRVGKEQSVIFPELWRCRDSYLLLPPSLLPLTKIVYSEPRKKL